MIKIPKFDLLQDGRGYLTDSFKFQTPIKGKTVAIHKAILCDDGELLVSEGFTWDFGSGPAIDTPAMIYGSLGHDVLYEMMGEDVLSWDHRATVDKWFKGLLKEAGMGWLRRNWVYWGVRMGHPVWSLFQ